MTIREKLEELDYEILPTIFDTGEYLIMHFTKTYKHIIFCNVRISVNSKDILDAKPIFWRLGLAGGKDNTPEKFANACVELEKEEDDFLEWCIQNGKMTEKNAKK